MKFLTALAITSIISLGTAAPSQAAPDKATVAIVSVSGTGGVL
jgi:hypothetical protein